MTEHDMARAAATGGESPRGNAATLERAIRHYNAHRYEQALAELQAGRGDPAAEASSTPEGDYYEGLALTQLGRHEEALLCLEKVVASHFSFLHIMQARMVLGYIYSVTGRYRLAEIEFTKVNELGLQSSQALAALGYVAYAQRNVEQSIETLKKALELEPKNSNALNSLGFIYAEEKIDLGRALTLCRQAVELSPRNPAYLDSLGWAYFRLGDYAEARATFRRALDLSPGNKEIAGHMRLCMDRLKELGSETSSRGR
ncbi:MAG TPA: tetratricopeptide repeat protein [Spirochaetia bacterium]|nr:tetratricopeptide repeat protein [Spirochaetia bacterium]